MVTMPVGKKDRQGFYAVAVQGFNYVFRVVAGIDYDPLAGLIVPDDVAVDLHRANN